MSAVSASGHAQLGTVRRRIPAWIRLGVDGTGHVVGTLALIGLAVYFLLVVSVPVRSIPTYPHAWLVVFATVGWVLWFGCYVWSVIRVLRGRRRQRTTQVVAIGGVAWSVALFAVLGPTFAALPALSFSVMLLCLAGRARGALTVVLLAAYVGLTTQQFAVGEVGLDLEEFALTALIFYAIPRLVIFAGELEQTRSEMAQLAVSEQRLRWARDLHDTLGHGLSVVLLKLELVERLSQRDPTRAYAELSDARSLLRESIGEMQTVVAGMRDLSLEGEIANARAILDSAGVLTNVDIAPVVLDEQVSQTLAWIVREGATNVLRHSDSNRCEITLRVERGRAVLTVANDGPAIKVTRSPSGGNGIRGMRERLHVLSGRLTAKSKKDGGFVLEASVPLPAAPVVAAPGDRAALDVAVEVEP
ncbi:MAG TPA: sensor histidine kinase [Pseudonocardiaceae bacterium]|nr:sensor histidine kinase [Pseudonocardiaceae bacterium]